MTERIDLGLGLSSADADQIASLVKRGVFVSRSVMYGAEHTSVTWSFSLGDDDDDETDEPSVSDDYMQSLLDRGAA